MTYDAIKIGLKIKQARKQKRLTQADLADILGLKTAAISKYETGKIKQIPFETRLKIVHILGLNFQDVGFAGTYNKSLASLVEVIDEI